MPVIMIHQIPANIKPHMLRTIIEQHIKCIRFYLRPRELKADNQYEKDGQYECGFFETPDIYEARDFVQKFNGKHITASSKSNTLIRGYVWSIELLNQGWEAVTQKTKDRQQQRDMILQTEMQQLGNLSRQYLEKLQADRNRNKDQMSCEWIRKTVPQKAIPQKVELSLEQIKWTKFL
ncbi:hypothetical protein SS50377_25512 [Spironucleus salmonicida]|uniref:Uncharacterized protein n=1 Tax=Spironucleus salmonicida TaxID=348837 RepID=V6LL15_9EUKA|nr:hypothetical protein SS50377_25512 [Spironucleus salmonicida]|eukprot:EST45058.1 Hypothetical protein SS50377_15079 [Spironucleus salmonicida]